MKAKKWGHLRTVFSTSSIVTLKWEIICEYLREIENMFENILRIYSGDKDLSIHAQKTRHQKSHATIPLTVIPKEIKIK